MVLSDPSALIHADIHLSHQITKSLHKNKRVLQNIKYRIPIVVSVLQNDVDVYRFAFLFLSAIENGVNGSSLTGVDDFSFGPFESGAIAGRHDIDLDVF